MQIDDCGIHSERLKKMHADIVEYSAKNGKNINSSRYNEIDMELYNAYQMILRIARDGGSISTALNDLESLINNGNVEISNLSKIATDVAVKAVAANEQSGLWEENKQISNVTAAIAIATIINSEKENKLMDSICSKEMEALHNETYNKALRGDTNSIAVIDLIDRASNYLVISDKLNSKGKEAGALALVAQLMDTNSKEAEIMAQNLVQSFSIDSVIENGVINLDRVRERFESICPGKKIESIVQKHKENVEEGKISAESSNPSFKSAFAQKIEKKKIKEFLKLFRNAVETGDEGLVEELVKTNIELAKKACISLNNTYGKFIQGKKQEPENFKLTRLKLGEVVGKNRYLTSSSKDDDSMER